MVNAGISKNVLRDNELANDIIDGNVKEIFSKMYFSSNEDLNALFDTFSVTGKDVLCVAASGDQFFHSYYRGANKVDTYDINPLSKHYLYLRKWIIEYLNMFYPNSVEFFFSDRLILNVLRNVKCTSQSEKESFDFWVLRVDDDLCDFALRNLFIICSRPYRNEIKDVSKLRDMIQGKEISFVHQDLSGEIDKSRKYDIVITSNILEYFCVDSCKLKICRDNLFDILNDGGHVICTYLLSDSFDYPRAAQKRVFAEKFDTKELYRDAGSSSYPVGYAYIKKGVNKK